MQQKIIGSSFLRVFLLASFMGVAVNMGVAADAEAQSRAAGGSFHLHVVPHIGVGGRGEGLDLFGPQVYGGFTAEADLGSRLRPVATAAVWTFPLTCIPTDPEDPEDCVNAGWNAEVGANFHPAPAGAWFSPFAGAGIGAGRLGLTRLLGSVRAGADLNAGGRAGLRFGAQLQHLFGAAEPTAAIFTAGVRLRVR